MNSDLFVGGDPSRLELTPEAMRALGHRVIDLIVDHHAHLGAARVATIATREALEAKLREAPPVRPVDPDAALERLLGDVVANCILPNHPRHFGWIPNPSNFVSVLGDALAAGFSLCPALWIEATGATVLELVSVDWLRELCGLPAGGGGLFVSGGSAANMTALATARAVRLKGDRARARIYTSDQTHRSNQKAAHLLGFTPDQIVAIASDERQQLRFEKLEEAVANDRARGLAPFCVVANAGTTNSGAVDPLQAIARLCREENLWFHVDGAYGAAAMLSPRSRRLMAGIEAADSITIDPHKWLFQPVEQGCILVRDMAHLGAAFSERQDYLQDTQRDETALSEINPCDYGLQLTRASRAIKFWLSVQVFGWEGFARAVERGLDNAETAERLLRAAGCFEIVSPARLAIVAFRYRGDAAEERLDAVNRALVEGVLADGSLMVSSTRLNGRTALRMCTINPRTTPEDLAAVVERLAAIGRAAERG